MLVDSARDAYVAIDAAGVVIEWNQRAAELFGWDRDDAVGELLAELIVPREFREAHLLGIRRFVETGRGNVAFQRLQFPALHRDGHHIEIEFTILPLRGPDSQWRFHAFLHDVTEERRQQGYLRLLQKAAVAANEADSPESAVRSALQAMQGVAEIRLAHAYLADGDERLRPTGWWFPAPLDPFSTVTASTTFAVGEGLPGRVAALGRPAWIQDLTEDHNFPRAEAALGSGLRAAFAFPVVTGARVVAVIEVFSNRPTEPDPRLLAVMETVGTQLGRVFERRQALRDLERLAEDREEIVSIVGHELRGPLSAAHAATGLLAEQVLEDGDEIDGELIAMMDRHLARLRRLVDSFLTAQRLEAGSLQAHPQPVTVLPVAREVAADLGLAETQIDVPDDLQVRADPDHLRQILWNLLANAARYGAPPIEVHASRRPGVTAIHVCDAGPGVPVELHDRLFERFGRAPGGTGTGLGLAIVRGLARINGGEASYVENGPSGHAFLVELPAQ